MKSIYQQIWKWRHTKISNALQFCGGKATKWKWEKFFPDYQKQIESFHTWRYFREQGRCIFLSKNEMERRTSSTSSSGKERNLRTIRAQFYMQFREICLFWEIWYSSLHSKNLLLIIKQPITYQTNNQDISMLLIILWRWWGTTMMWWDFPNSSKKQHKQLETGSSVNWGNLHMTWNSQIELIRFNSILRNVFIAELQNSHVISTWNVQQKFFNWGCFSPSWSFDDWRNRNNKSILKVFR